MVLFIKASNNTLEDELMKKYSFPISIFSLVTLIILSVFATSCIPFQALIARNKPDTKISVQTPNPERIYALDYDPIKNTVSYVKSEDWRSSAEKEKQHIISYNLETGHKTIIEEGFSHLLITWIGIGRQGELYVLDRGSSLSTPDSNEMFLLVYKEGELIDKYALEFLNMNGSDSCSRYLNSGSDAFYLGIERDKDHGFYPKFILFEKDDGSIAAYDPQYCDKSIFNNDIDTYIEKNIQKINEKTYKDTYKNPKYIWVNHENDFRYSEPLSTTYWYANMECERVFDYVQFHGRRYNMGQCIRSILALPSSGNFFDTNGDLIFVNLRGINILEK